MSRPSCVPVLENKTDQIVPDAIVLWHNIHLFEKVVRAFDAKDVFLQIEVIDDRFYLFGILQPGTQILCFYEIRFPHCKVKTQSNAFYAIFNATIFLKSIKSFVKANKLCDRMEMHLFNSEYLELFAFSSNVKRGGIKILAAAADAACEFNSYELQRNFGWDYEVNIPLDASEFLNGLISLDATQQTKIVLKENQLYFECKDESSYSSQTQFVPVSVLNGQNAAHSASFAHAGMVSMQKFVASITNHKLNQEEEKETEEKSDQSEQVTKKRKKPEEKKRKLASHPITKSLFVKMDSTHPMELIYEQSDLVCKLFVPAQTEE